MLLTTQLPRVFTLKEENTIIQLADPDPDWAIEEVMNYYSTMYPSLVTAKTSKPKITNDTIIYHFDTAIGTKG